MLTTVTPDAPAGRTIYAHDICRCLKQADRAREARHPLSERSQQWKQLLLRFPMVVGSHSLQAGTIEPLLMEAAARPCKGRDAAHAARAPGHLKGKGLQYIKLRIWLVTVCQADATYQAWDRCSAESESWCLQAAGPSLLLTSGATLVDVKMSGQVLTMQPCRCFG